MALFWGSRARELQHCDVVYRFGGVQQRRISIHHQTDRGERDVVLSSVMMAVVMYCLGVSGSNATSSLCLQWAVNTWCDGASMVESWRLI